MKIGMIIIFHNNEKDIDVDTFADQLNLASNLEVCLVNNDSKDETYQLLKAVKENCTNISVVNIRKFKSEIAAVRAGARYMFNEFNISHIGYVTVEELISSDTSLDDSIEMISQNQDAILKYNIEYLERKTSKQTLFQRLFSVLDYLIQLKIGEQRVIHQ